MYICFEYFCSLLSESGRISNNVKRNRRCIFRNFTQRQNIIRVIENSESPKVHCAEWEIGFAQSKNSLCHSENRPFPELKDAFFFHRPDFRSTCDSYLTGNEGTKTRETLRYKKGKKGKKLQKYWIKIETKQMVK